MAAIPERGRWNANPNPFRYNVAASGDRIRLVRILPESREYNIKLELVIEAVDWHDGGTAQIRPYEALSYCWGHPNLTEEILLNGQSFMVTGNLHAALGALHDTNYATPSIPSRSDAGHTRSYQKWYWIDAVCINQRDIEERTQQVRQMWRIFHGARKVIAWFGTSCEEVSDLAVALETVKNPALDACLRAMEEETIDLAIDYLLSCEYFRRTWIIPEIMQAQNVTLRCGNVSLDWTADFIPWLQRSYRAKEPRHSRARKLCMARARLQDNKSLPSEIFSIYARTECSDVRDKIFAMLSDPRLQLSGPVAWLRADYSMSKEEVWLMAMKEHFHELDRGRQEGLFTESDAKAFEMLLSSALEVDPSDSAFNQWLIGHIEAAWESSEGDVAVTRLWEGGHAALSLKVHPMIRPILATEPTAESTEDAEGTAAK